MATLAVKDANDTIRYIEVTGAGTTGDPFVPVHSIDNQISGFATQTTLNDFYQLATVGGTGLKVSNFPSSFSVSNQITGFSTETTLNSFYQLATAGGTGLKISNFPASFSVSNQITGYATDTAQTELVNKSFGKQGIQLVNDTTPVTGTFFALTTITATTIASMTATGTTSPPIGVELPANFTIYVPITAITLTSGSIILYKS